MRKKRMRSKRNPFKNILLRKSIWIVLLVFVSSIFCIPTFSSKADDNISLDILEINPGNKHSLDSTGNIKVTHMTMAEYISMVDEINGKYDVVVIGRNNSGLNNYFDTNEAYRDYTAPFSQEVTDMKSWGSYTRDNSGSIDGVGIKYATKLWYIQSDVATTKKWGDFEGKNSGYYYDKVSSETGNYVEYLSENDITNKRAKEILNLINSGQLVYINNNILDDSNLKNSKLQSNFKNIYKDNFKRFTNISIDTIKSDYSNIVKNRNNSRPGLTITKKPTDDGKSAEKGNLNNRNMTFSFTTAGVDENATVKLYLDYNGDGLFKDDEEASIGGSNKLSLYKTNENNYTISHNLDTTFIGYLQWKLVITNSNGVNNYAIGDGIYKALDGKRQEIDVMQIHPQSKTQIKDLYLDGTFYNEYLKNLPDYKITMDVRPVHSLNGVTGFNELVAREGKNYILDKYDMLIVGFSDGYGNGINNEFSKAACETISAFIKRGKAVMFTHDTMSLNSFGGNDWNDEWDSLTGPKYLTKVFRDAIGQSRYADPYNPSGKDLLTLTNENGEVIEKTITHDSVLTSEVQKNHSNVEASKIKTLGTTLFANVAFWQDKTLTNQITQVNKAQITSYPYDLNSKQILNVASTHTQWYQLNLEDEDVVPWYNLNSSKFDTGDSRNFYYGYSKGNVTYSGTGHSTVNNPDEFQLFVNTIVKCIRGANAKPNVVNKRVDIKNSVIENENIEKVTKGEAYKFIALPTDINGDLMTVTIKVDNKEFLSHDKVRNNTKINVEIPAYLTANKNKGDKIKIETQAKDSHGAESEVKTFYVEITEPDYKPIDRELF
ncbi:MAG: DUF5057 domain-containing protein [Clostridiales bacterium]|nr:DUF5057 domain-containing protein [Clostridiales bacterium]